MIDALIDRAPLDPPPDDPPVIPTPAAVVVAVATEEFDIPAGVAIGSVLTTLHDAVVVEFGLYGR